MEYKEEFWKGKKIFITGASGFIGSSLVKKLSQLGADITAFSYKNKNSLLDILPNMKIIKGDITKYFPDLDDFEYIFHTAAIVGDKKCHEDKKYAFSVNMKGTENILKATKHEDIKKFIYLSTSYVYGNKPGASEEDIPYPLDLYSKTKFLGEKKVEEYHKRYGLPISIIRMSNAYGPEQKFGIIPSFIDKIRNNQELIVFDSSKDFIYIKDAISGILFIAAYGEGIYNLGKGKETSIKKLAEVLIKELYGSSNIKVIDNDKIKRNYLNITKIKKLGWNPKYSLEKGLKEVLRYQNGRNNTKDNGRN